MIKIKYVTLFTLSFLIFSCKENISTEKKAEDSIEKIKGEEIPKNSAVSVTKENEISKLIAGGSEPSWNLFVNKLDGGGYSFKLLTLATDEGEIRGALQLTEGSMNSSEQRVVFKGTDHNENSIEITRSNLECTDMSGQSHKRTVQVNWKTFNFSGCDYTKK